MKHLDEYRDAELARKLVKKIRSTASRCWTIMEVCGGQTHSLLRHGIETELAGVVELLHGPGCPVCVTPAELIDHACELALQPDVLVATIEAQQAGLLEGLRKALASEEQEESQ